ncbi:MAG: DUF452 family protein [Muribaculaceae bacterium]|nr:DUF452 family protein [Muribaculaceae bacterium]
MKHAYISRKGESRLIIIFAGWGMDHRPFQGLERPGYDIMAVWDYRSLDFNARWTEGYDEVAVLAWSMGVHAAQACHGAIAEKTTGRIAVAGTPCPVHDSLGIPQGVFDATLANLDEANLARFMRRMCGGASGYKAFAGRMPQRPVEELREELAAIGCRVARGECTATPPFDHYVATMRDSIFPPANQLKAFEGCDVVEIDSPHLPDFQALLDRFFIDKSLVAERFEGARSSYDANAEAQALIARYMANQLRDKDSAAILASPEATVLEIGCGTGLLSRRLLAARPAARMIFWDIAAQAPDCLPSGSYRCCDAETAISGLPAASVDMIVSASAIQWFNSQLSFARRALHALKPGGILAVSTFSRGNMHETAGASGHSLQLPDAGVWESFAASQPCVEKIHIGGFPIVCRFHNAMDAMRHISRTGVNALSRAATGARSVAARLIPDSDGRYCLTYKPLFIILRKKP